MTRGAGVVRLFAAAVASAGLMLAVGVPGASATSHIPGQGNSVWLSHNRVTGTNAPGGASQAYPQARRSAAGSPAYFLNSGEATFTVKGQKIKFAIGASKGQLIPDSVVRSAPSSTSITVSVSKNLEEVRRAARISSGPARRASASNGEGHDFWFQNLRKRDLQVTGSGGTASKVRVSVGPSEIGPFGSLNLTFKLPRSFKKEKCSNAAQGYYDHYYMGPLKGSVNFKTVNSNEPSSFGNFKRSVTLKHTDFDIDNGCQYEGITTSISCEKGISWSSPSAVAISGGYTGQKQVVGQKATSATFAFNEVEAFRDVGLTGLETGVRGTRYDVVETSAESQSLSTGTTTPPSLTINATTRSSKQFFAGSATETSASSNESDGEKCSVNGKGSPTKTQHETLGVAPFTFTPGPSRSIGKSGIGGDIVPAPVTDQDGSHQAYIQSESYS